MWSERHRPKSLSQIRGQDAAVTALRHWAASWEKGTVKRKAALLHGPAGIGKTSAAVALGADMGWEVLEVNASDKRSESSLQEFLKSSRTRYSLLSGPGLRLYVIDEVDGLSGREDRGGARAIAQMISLSANPVILICNDYYSPRLRQLRRITRGIQFTRPRKSTVQSVLGEICRREGIEPDLLALNLIAERADGDLRSAINDLEAVSMRGRLSRDDLRVPAKRKTDTNVYHVLDLIFNGDRESRAEALDLDMRPDQLLEWVAENAHQRFLRREDRARAYETVSIADVYLSHVGRRMHWAFWGYATDLMTRGIGAIAEMTYPHYGTRYRYAPPRDYARHRYVMNALSGGAGTDSRGTEVSSETEAAHLIGRRCHMSTREVITEFLPYLRIIQENDAEKAAAILRSVGISDEDMCNLPYG